MRKKREMNTVTIEAAREERIRIALRLEALTLVWMVVEAAGSIGAGVVSRSVLLIAFGADSVIELLSAGLLYFRLSREAKAAREDSEKSRASKKGSLG